MLTCHNCGRTVPSGTFCGVCGAELGRANRSGARRHNAFAADPSEHAFRLSVVTTLLPHLPHRRTRPFRIALGVSAGLLLLLGLLRLTGPAVAAATILVPLLYLIYVYEVELYEDRPFLVVGLAVALGIVFGIPWALVVGPFLTETQILASAQGLEPGRVLLAAVLLPLLAQLLMLASALVLYWAAKFTEALDGFAFGIAGALGFTFITTLFELLPDIQHGLSAGGPSIVNAFYIFERGMLVPLINASTTGLIAGALWLRPGRPKDASSVPTWTVAVGTAVAIAAGVQILLAVSSLLVASALMRFAIYVLVAVALLIWVRVAIHHMLLIEAADVTVGPLLPCSHCHRVVHRMAFCPNCGVATRATPKTGLGRRAVPVG